MFSSWFVFETALDLCFLIDVVVNFFTAYTSEETGLAVVDSTKIARNYLKSWFLCDVISSARRMSRCPRYVLEGGSNVHVTEIDRGQMLVRWTDSWGAHKHSYVNIREW